MRIEKDSLGELQVPENALYGVQVARALTNFPISGQTISKELVSAYGLLKKACALANLDLGLLKKEIADPILKACDEVISGALSEHFPVDIYQAGAGTSTNMNLNEVIANRALEVLDQPRGTYSVISPNDHVNMAQSTNDTYPTAMRIALVQMVPALDAKLTKLEKAFTTKGKEFAEVLKSARTHLQDAVPITLGQEFTAWGITLSAMREEIENAKKSLEVLGIGGSAAGTGINVDPEFSKKVVAHLNKLTPHNFKNAPDLIESMESQRQIQKFAAALKSTAIEMSRIASDLRLLASGPNTGFYEIELPAVQPGSSIMPGKVNPSILECVNMVCYRVMGAESAVSYATLGGQLDLNVNMPLMSAELIHSTQILGNAAEMMADQCVSGISANVEKCRDFALKSASLATALNPILGYAKVAEIVKEFVKTGKSFPDIIKEKGLLTDMQIKKVLAPENMTRPGIAKL